MHPSSSQLQLITPCASSSCINRLLQIADMKALEEENTNTKTNKQATQGVMALAASYASNFLAKVFKNKKKFILPSGNNLHLCSRFFFFKVLIIVKN